MRRWDSPSTRLIVLLTVLVTLGPLSTDLYLPALPLIRRELNASESLVQLTLSAYLAAFAVAQLFYGALSDRFGRRSVLLIGLLIYLLASWACTQADNIGELILLRMLQGLGACSGPVIGRAVVRDVWSGMEVARIMAITSGAMALAPMFAPLLGSLITESFGWQGNFVALALLALFQIVFTSLWLGETNRYKDTHATNLRRMLRNFGAMLSVRDYLGHLMLLSFSFGGLFAFVSGASFVFIDHYGLSLTQFGMAFAVMVMGYITGTLCVARMQYRIGGERLLRVGVRLSATSAVLMMLFHGLEYWPMVSLIIGQFFVAVGIGIVMPMAFARALLPFPQMAGAASALLGFMQAMFASLVGVLVGSGISIHINALPFAICICMLLTWLCHHFLFREVVAKS